MSIAYYASNQILDRLFGATAYNSPATWYVGLSTTTINSDGTGATEPVAGAYARVAVTNNKSNFSVAANGSLSNAAVVQFVESTASWGTITYVFLSDALTSGNIWVYDVLSTAKTVQSYTTVLFSIGAMVFSMTNT